jgi:hypothetical protein
MYICRCVLKMIILQVCDRNDVEVWNEDRQPENEQDEDVEIEDEDSDIARDMIETDKLISTGEALKSLNNVIQWAEENSDEVEYSSVVALQDLRAKLVKKMYNKPTKQTKVTHFFSLLGNYILHRLFSIMYFFQNLGFFILFYNYCRYVLIA